MLLLTCGGCCSLDLWEAAGHFWRQLSKGDGGLALPDAVCNYLTFMRSALFTQTELGMK